MSEATINTVINFAIFVLMLAVAVGGLVMYFRGVDRDVRADMGKQRDDLERQMQSMRAEADSRAAERKATTSELHRRIDETRSEQAAFRELVPQQYATISYLRDVEARLVGNVKETEARLAADISASEQRLTTVLTRLDDKLDGRKT